MYRELSKNLLHWKNNGPQMPILLRGARQVGKSYLVEQFGRAHFDNTIIVNFELNPEYSDCFKSLEPENIIREISVLYNQSIMPGKTLLFLDEIQECPQAIMALRYFKEKIPQLHVIAAGSLLEFVLNDANFRMPVGRILYFYLKPLTFQEFLLAMQETHFLQYLQEINLDTKISDVIHKKGLSLVRLYMMLGGMPSVINSYLQNQDFNQCQHIQSALLKTYRDDFGKYSSRSNLKYLQKMFEKAPTLVGQHIKYSKIDPESRSRELKEAFNNLKLAGLICPIYATTASGLPLNTLINEKKFKCIFLDIGLVQKISRIDANILLNEDIMLINQGALAEQFVGQELLAHGSLYEEGELFFWETEKPGNRAEIDFVAQCNSHIIPVEVKAGQTGRLKSLKIFMEEKQSRLGIRISTLPFGVTKNILSVPLYMISELNRIVPLFLKQT